MNYRNLLPETWERLDVSGNIVSGYKSLILTGSNTLAPVLHLFIDEKGFMHLAVETTVRSIIDPSVNGLTVKVQTYRMSGGDVSSMIDVCCPIRTYVEEFTGIVKELAECIIDKSENPADAVCSVIQNWKVFWGNQGRTILTEEEIIGLICELEVLNRLCSINTTTALSSWLGPLMGKADFNFTSWELEIKATRNSKIIHTINGLDQLMSNPGKSLGLISFLVTVNDNEKSISLPLLITRIKQAYLITKPDLMIRFNELLAAAGYNPIFAEHYRNFQIELLKSTFYIVEETFPKLTLEELTGPLNSRISGIRYSISLDGIQGKKLDEISLGDYFY